MTTNTPKQTTAINPLALVAGLVVLVMTIFLIGIDVAEGIGLVSDQDMAPALITAFELAEMLSVLGLVLFTYYLFRILTHLARRDVNRERTLSLLRGQFGEVMEQRFDDWRLTPAERDVAMLMLKGLNVADISAARTTAQGTVKAQSTAIFRKAGVASKSELLSMMIDEFLDVPTNHPTSPAK